MQTHGGGNGRKQQFRERLGVLRDTAVKRHLPEGRWTRRHWIHASLFTTIGVLMATIVPGFSSAIQAPVSQPRNTLLLELTHGADSQDAHSRAAIADAHYSVFILAVADRGGVLPSRSSVS